ncbi:UMP-CMP kinase 2, mitochondrial-like [Homalodisca vitripennis]|uniref:UMP-CMP kinase 2, mitochondrial-like n=1 Tax=Homalodisca vitripennis TaxID=197043 RepID=UPI001EEA8255|nr:UMP-CMP kinase 2, mitochondrial-like [Homalodisca vitripennis]
MENKKGRISIFEVIKHSQLVKYFTMLFFLVVNFFSPTHSDELKEIGFKDSSKFGVFYSLQTILDTLDETRYQNKPKVHQLLGVFENHCKPRDSRPLSSSRPYPFIVIEGAQRTGRRILGKALAKSIGAKAVVGIPRCMIKLRHQFDTESELKRTFFGLCNYITAFNIRHMVENMPVVLIGYWMDQATFNIAKEYPNVLPPPSSFIYKFPTDLLAPDIIFYLNTPREDLQGNLLNLDFNRKIMEIYRRMREPNVTEIHGRYVTEQFINELRTVMRGKLQHKYPHLVL